MQRPVLLAVCCEFSIGLLIALAWMAGSGYRATGYFLLAVLVGIAWYLARLDRLAHENEVREQPVVHVPMGAFAKTHKATVTDLASRRRERAS
jgi:hypothetical protein